MLQIGKPRGVVILFSVFIVILMIAFGGLAIDVGSMLTERSELHRATDAGALAGAGNLGFDDSVFPAVRAAAVNFASMNPSRYGPVNLDLNWANAASGDVVLGIWNAGTFTPSLDGNMVNAVLCQTQKSFPTSFLRVIGLNSLTMSSVSVAVSGPPSTPPTGCAFPIGIPICQFMDASGNYTNTSCGMPLRFISSSSIDPNNAAWVNVTGTDTPNVTDLRAALDASYNAYLNGGQCQGVAVPVAQQNQVGATNGEKQSVFMYLEDYFKSVWNDPNNTTTYSITNMDTGTAAYTGRGWKVSMPLIFAPCPVQVINQTVGVATYADFVITQVINNKKCAVTNPADTNSVNACNGVNPPNFAIYGYLDCSKKYDLNPVVNPAPRVALGDRMRLVR